MSEHEILVQHMVDIEKATAEFREAPERKHATSSHMNSSSKRFATRSIVQRRPRRGKEDAFEQQLAGGMSLPCKKRLTASTTSFSQIAST